MGRKVLLGREEMGELSFSRSDMGLGLLPMKSMHLTAQASGNTGPAALMELRSQASVFLRSAGALPSPGSREGLQATQIKQGKQLCLFLLSPPTVQTPLRVGPGTACLEVRTRPVHSQNFTG